MFDAAILATGAQARRLPFGHDLDGVPVLRTIADALRMKEQLAVAERVVVSGAGFLGLEIASVARQMGKDVVVLDSLKLPMMRPFGMPARAGGSAQTGRTRARARGTRGNPGPGRLSWRHGGVTGRTGRINANAYGPRSGRLAYVLISPDELIRDFGATASIAGTVGWPCEIRGEVLPAPHPAAVIVARRIRGGVRVRAEVWH